MKAVSGHSRMKDSRFKKYQAKLSKIRGNGELIEMVLKDDWDSVNVKSKVRWCRDDQLIFELKILNWGWKFWGGMSIRSCSKSGNFELFESSNLKWCRVGMKSCVWMGYQNHISRDTSSMICEVFKRRRLPSAGTPHWEKPHSVPFRCSKVSVCTLRGLVLTASVSLVGLFLDYEAYSWSLSWY